MCKYVRDRTVHPGVCASELTLNTCDYSWEDTVDFGVGTPAHGLASWPISVPTCRMDLTTKGQLAISHRHAEMPGVFVPFPPLRRSGFHFIVAKFERLRRCCCFTVLL